MKHKHHIIPRHMGGIDDPSNIVELSIEEHAEAHRILYESYGYEEDRIAWQGLSGMINKEAIIKSAQSLGAKKCLEIHGNPWSGMRTATNFAENKDLQIRAGESANSAQSITKKKITYADINHQQGEKNSQYGRMWISDPLTKEVRRLEKNESIPEGWIRGKKGHVPKKLWVNNDTEEHYILIDKLNDYTAKGFNRGRLKKSMPQNRIVV